MARAQADAFDRQKNRRGFLQKVGGVMASSPDLSTTRHGPVQLGPRLPSQTVEAQGGEGSGAPGNVISAQQVGEESLKAGQAVTAQPAEEGSSNGSQAASVDTKAKNGEGSPDAAQNSKKKGKFHFLKKVVKPF